MSFLVKIALNHIKNGIQSHAKENGIPEGNLYLMIFPKDEDFTPGFKLCNRVNAIKEVTFVELIKISSIMGFQIDKEGELWVRRFLIKSAGDRSLGYNNHFYFIRIRNNSLQAYLYMNNYPVEEISLEYILTT
ncbi:MAG: hypothetical protein PHT07_15155 [Paludibacter sp.]|nr:hypothetical protein [Paludibacter sp.]